MLKAINECNESIVVVIIGRGAMEVNITTELFGSIMITEMEKESTNGGTVRKGTKRRRKESGLGNVVDGARYSYSRKNHATQIENQR